MNKNSNQPSFSVIIPNYNGAEFLPSCLISLIKSIGNCPHNQFEVILVDNNSQDHSPKLAKKILSQKPSNLLFTIHRLPSNLGFASSVNQGIKKSKYDWIVVLNNDLIMEENWFQIISQKIKTNQNPKIVTFFGTILNSDGTKFESQGFEYNYSGKCQNISNGQKFVPSTIYHLPSTIYIWGAPAALIVYNKNIIKRVGFFDEDFFAYEEDVDLSFRLAQLGYQTIYVPTALSYHLGGGTSSKMGNLRYRLVFRNWFYLIIKNYSLKKFCQNFFPIIIERLRLLFEFVIQTIKIYQIKSLIILPFDLIKTFAEIVFYTPKMLYKRHQIKKLLEYSNN